MEKNNWEWMLHHSHWVTITIRGRNIRLCSRCLGTVLGFSVIFPIFFILNVNVPLNYIVFSYLLCTPTFIDWITQSWEIRHSNNRVRLSTGFLEGSGIAVFAALSLPFFLKLHILVYTIIAVFTVGFIGKLLINNKRRY